MSYYFIFFNDHVIRHYNFYLFIFYYLFSAAFIGHNSPLKLFLIIRLESQKGEHNFRLLYFLALKRFTKMEKSTGTTFGNGGLQPYPIPQKHKRDSLKNTFTGIKKSV